MGATQADLVSMIQSGDLPKLRDELSHWRPQDLADALAGLAKEDQVIAFR